MICFGMIQPRLLGPGSTRPMATMKRKAAGVKKLFAWESIRMLRSRYAVHIHWSGGQAFCRPQYLFYFIIGKMKVTRTVKSLCLGVTLWFHVSCCRFFPFHTFSVWLCNIDVVFTPGAYVSFRPLKMPWHGSKDSSPVWTRCPCRPAKCQQHSLVFGGYKIFLYTLF